MACSALRFDLVVLGEREHLSLPEAVHFYALFWSSTRPSRTSDTYSECLTVRCKVHWSAILVPFLPYVPCGNQWTNRNFVDIPLIRNAWAYIFPWVMLVFPGFPPLVTQNSQYPRKPSRGTMLAGEGIGAILNDLAHAVQKVASSCVVV